MKFLHAQVYFIYIYIYIYVYIYISCDSHNNLVNLKFLFAQPHDTFAPSAQIERERGGGGGHALGGGGSTRKFTQPHQPHYDLVNLSRSSAYRGGGGGGAGGYSNMAGNSNLAGHIHVKREGETPTGLSSANSREMPPLGGPVPSYAQGMLGGGTEDG